MGENKKMNKNGVKVTVLMSVYNSQDYLDDAIKSILTQTYKNFEFLIIDDGSTDDSLKIINSYKDKRIRVVSRENKGLVYSLNQGLKLAKGEFIARQDSDDISLPHRLEKEIVFLENNDNIGMVGSNYTIINTQGKKLVTTNVFTHPNDLKLAQIACNQFGHGSVMMRKKTVLKCGGYDSRVGHVEDYHLWNRISRVADIANIEEPLYLYRTNPEGITQQNHELQIQQTFKVRDESFEYFLKHRMQYKLIFYRPSGLNYKQRKATLYRDFAYLYRKNDRPVRALLMLILSALLDPNNKKTYSAMQYTIYKPRFDRWVYEFL
jgi:glycosyltransferase involved in cell wall biosynthesis